MKRANLAAVAASILVCLSLVSLAQDKKAGSIKEASGGEMGELRLRTMAPITYVYVETETTFDKLGDAIGEAMPKLTQAAHDGKFRLAEPFMLVYPGNSAHLTPEKPFKVQIGTKVEGDAVASGDVKVRAAQEFLHRD